MRASSILLHRAAICLSLVGFLFSVSAAEKPRIKVMLLTGQCSRYHNWKVSSVVLKRELEAAGIFAVDTVTSPPQGADMSGFKPDFAKYDVVVMDYDGDEWPESTRKAFTTFIDDGGGLVTVHAADNAFPHWPEFNQMIGIGGWEGRTESAGVKVRWRDGGMVVDQTPGTATHPPKHDFLVVTRSPNHPIMQGLPAEWLHASDELYSQLRGPAENLTVLATASADPAKHPNGTGMNEPMLMAIRFGKGRIFHTTLGHVGPRDNEATAAVNCVGFITTFQRGTEWAAKGEVTLPVPSDFPGTEKTSVRKP
ncbi:ThuA domain-containing protein [bacterium]|nr:ThuA domain-containing protein [bacterium]